VAEARPGRGALDRRAVEEREVLWHGHPDQRFEDQQDRDHPGHREPERGDGSGSRARSDRHAESTSKICAVGAVQGACRTTLTLTLSRRMPKMTGVIKR